MDYYKSDRDIPKPKRKRPPFLKGKGALLIAMALTAAAAAGAAAFAYMSFDPGSYPGAARMKNVVLNVFLQREPKLYHLIVEKNGQDMTITGSDTFEVTYRDQFIIKEVVTDSLLNRGITVDFGGMGGKDDFGVLLKGVDLIDNFMQTANPHLKDSGEISIRVLFHEKPIAAIPVNAAILPQDWVRFAKAADKEGTQIDYLKKAVTSNRRDANVRKMLAAAYVKSGKAPLGIAEYENVLKIKHDDATALSELSRLYLDQKRYSEAIAVSRKVVASNPKDASAHANLGYAYEKSGNMEQAMGSYQESLKHDPRNVAIRYRAAGVYEKLGKNTEAANQYKEILKSRPGDTNALTGLSEIYFKTGKYDEAIQNYRELAKRSPRSASAHANLGLAYGEKGLIQEEIASYNRALAISPNDPNIRYNLALAYESQKKYPQAMKELERILKSKPDDSDALAKLADIHVREKRYSEAIKLFERAAGKTNNPAVHAGLGYVYGEAKKYQKSAQSYEKAIRLGSKDPQVHYNLAYTYDKLGNRKKATAAFEKAAAKKASPETITALAEHYIKQKNYDQAIKAYQRLIKLAPGKSAGYCGMAHVYGLKGDVNREIDFYKAALQHEKNDDNAHFRLGEAYEKKQLYEEALKEYSAAYQINPELARAGQKIPQMRIKILELKYKD